VSDLLKHAKAMGLSNARAQIAADNTVSLHLLRRAGFKVNGWDKPANLRRGSIDCLLLSRSLRPAVGVALTGSHVHLSA
jgi:RimJ/RimL family protein N-acetyltransferase